MSQTTRTASHRSLPSEERSGSGCQTSPIRQTAAKASLSERPSAISGRIDFDALRSKLPLSVENSLVQSGRSLLSRHGRFGCLDGDAELLGVPRQNVAVRVG